jgi:hypothetical protein
MIPFDMSVSFVAGQTLALSARRRLADEPNIWVNKPLMVSLLWMTLIYAPSAMFFYHGWSAWNSVYILKDVSGGGSPDYPDFGSNRLFWESILIWLDCTVLVGIFYTAFALAHKWIRAGEVKKATRACIFVVVLLVGYCALTFERSFVVTTYESWERLKALGIQFGDIFTWKGHGGTMFLGHQVFWANAVIAFIDFGPLAYLYYRFSRPAARRGQSW